MKELNPEHRRVAEAATERIKRAIAGPVLRALERGDTELADAINSQDDAS